MYASLLKDKFPQDEKNGLYKAPNLPAVKLGKILISDTRIASPNDVIAVHLHSGTFSKSVLIFTKDRCFYPEGSFMLEDVKEVQVDGGRIVVFANQQAQLVPHKISVKNEQVAQILKKLLESIAYHDPTAAAMVKNAYEGYSTTELDWLNLRDEIMRTIDMLYDRYNDGKISILDYEEKKQELLSRL
ncbi:MAG: hypothetical protein R3C61_22890 [Bacteroidia bacterium]